MEKTKSEMDILKYITELEETLTGKEITFVKAAYFITKDKFEECQYFDIIQASCEAIFSNRSLSGSMMFEKILTNIYTTVGKDEEKGISLDELNDGYPAAPCMNEDRLDATKCLRELLALFDMDRVDSIEDEIFLRVLNCEEISKLANMYHISCDSIVRIYDEKLALVNGIRVVDGKVYVDEEENYSKRLDEHLADIREKIFR